MGSTTSVSAREHCPLQANYHLLHLL